MPATYDSIATTTLNGTSSVISFSSIPNTYTDLKIIVTNMTVTSSIGTATIMRFNGDSANNYSQTVMFAFGSTLSSGRFSNQPHIYINEDSIDTAIPTAYIIDIFSYAQTSLRKTVLGQSLENKNTSGAAAFRCGFYDATNAINAITISQFSGVNYGSGTRATLYGILRA